MAAPVIRVRLDGIGQGAEFRAVQPFGGLPRRDRRIRGTSGHAFLRGALALFISAAVLGTPSRPAYAQTEEPTSPTDAEARANFEAGVVAYNDGRVSDALGYFQRAYDLSHRPELLFNVATAHERLRHDAEAIAAYQGYLDQVPDAPNRRFVEERIAFLRQASTTPTGPSAEPVTAVVPTPEDAARAAEPASAPTASAPTSDDRASQPLVKRWWFWTTIGAVVVAGVVTGVVLGTRGDAGTQSPVPGDVGAGGVVVTRLGR